MTALVAFDHVTKRFRLRHDRPRSFRELFLGGMLSRVGAGNGTLEALKDVSFTIERGETVGLIGPNGAGKSTALKLISRVIAPSDGRVAVSGRVAALLELGTGFHPDLSGRENIYLSGALIGMSRREMQRKFGAIVDFSELGAFIDMPVKHYSSGMFARLAFAVSIHLDPEVLLVDEVLAVGDQAFQQKCLDRIADLQRLGVTICMVSHAADTVRALCTRAIWFDHGRLLADGPADMVVRRYLDQVTGEEAGRLAQEAGPHTSQRWGSGQIEIVRVRLAGEQGREQTVYQTGDVLALYLDYQTGGRVSSAVFGMAIHRQDGIHICGPNTAFAGLELSDLEGEGTVTYSVPYLPLLDGLYYVSVSVHNREETEMYDYHDRAYPFRVVNRNGPVQERYGMFTLRGEWRHAFAAAVRT